MKILTGQRRVGKSYIMRQVAMKDYRMLYIQSTYILADEQTVLREYAPLEAISDNYEKMVVSLDELALPLREGIRHVQAWKLHEIL